MACRVLGPDVVRHEPGRRVVSAIEEVGRRGYYLVFVGLNVGKHNRVEQKMQRDRADGQEEEQVPAIFSDVKEVSKIGHADVQPEAAIVRFDQLFSRGRCQDLHAVVATAEQDGAEDVDD